MLPDTVKSEPADTGSDPFVTSAPSRTRELVRRLEQWASSERLLLAVLLGMFLARFLAADHNSYWLDEIYSVTIHGTWNESLSDLIAVLAETTVYPPMYFAILFEWMSAFGDSEMATRLLSNIYVTLAGLFLYLAMRIGFSRRVALTSVIGFSLMYASMYHGLETRPYAQNIFLATLSSYLVLRLLRNSVDKGWRRTLISPTGSVFCVTNILLLLTHYYNAFFWGAQALAVCVFVLWERRPSRWLHGIGVVVGLYGLQLAVFFGIWGRAALNAFDRQAEANTIDGAAELPNPFSVLLDSVVLPNIQAPAPIGWIAIALTAALIAGAVAVLLRPHALAAERFRAWITLYLFMWLSLPFVVAYFAFLAAGVARYSERYFVFSAVPLVPLIVLLIEAAVYVIKRPNQRNQPVTHSESSLRSHNRMATSLGLLTLAVLILPGAYDAINEPRADWRGTARTVVEIIESNPENTYAVYETSFRGFPVLDYYFSRFSDKIRVMGTIPRYEERQGEEFSFERNADSISSRDFLIVPFIHHTTAHFPVALDRLRGLYDVHHWQMDRNGRGIVIFSVSAEE